jgi:uncharacterized lipoprotein YddW (UPF0748 family)
MLVFILVSSFIVLSSVSAQSLPRKGLWIEAEGEVRPFSDKKEFNKLIKTLHKYSFTDIYIQVYRNGKSWFPSSISDETPYIRNIEKGFDPIPLLIRYCKAHNIRVHAWINVFRMGESAPFLKRAGVSTVLHDIHGRSLLETKGEGVPGCRPDTPGIWLDPSHREVRRNALFVIRDLIKLYPELSGIHFDYIRYPFPFAGQGETKEKYCSRFVNTETLQKLGSQRAMLSAHQADFNLEELNNDHSITDFLKIVRHYVDKKAPHLEMSAAVLSNVERAIKYGKQDWPLWLRMGLLDTVVTMNYTTDAERFLREARESSNFAKGKVLIGLGAWLSLSKPDILYRDLKNIRNLSSQGVVLFSYANLANPNGMALFGHLEAYPFRQAR